MYSSQQFYSISNEKQQNKTQSTIVKSTKLIDRCGFFSYRSTTWMPKLTTSAVNCKYSSYSISLTKSTNYGRFMTNGFVVYLIVNFCSVLYVHSNIALSQLSRRSRNTRTNSPNCKRRLPNSTSVTNLRWSRRRNSPWKKKRKRYVSLYLFCFYKFFTFSIDHLLFQIQILLINLLQTKHQIFCTITLEKWKKKKKTK